MIIDFIKYMTIIINVMYSRFLNLYTHVDDNGEIQMIWLDGKKIYD